MGNDVTSFHLDFSPPLLGKAGQVRTRSSKRLEGKFSSLLDFYPAKFMNLCRGEGHDTDGTRGKVQRILLKRKFESKASAGWLLARRQPASYKSKYVARAFTRTCVLGQELTMCQNYFYFSRVRGYIYDGAVHSSSLLPSQNQPTYYSSYHSCVLRSPYTKTILSSRNEKEIARVCARFAFARFVSQRRVNSQRQLLINYFVRLNEIII